MKQSSGIKVPDQYLPATEAALFALADKAKYLADLLAEYNPDKIIELKYHNLKITVEKL